MVTVWDQHDWRPIVTTWQLDEPTTTEETLEEVLASLLAFWFIQRDPNMDAGAAVESAGRVLVESRQEALKDSTTRRWYLDDLVSRVGNLLAPGTDNPQAVCYAGILEINRVAQEIVDGLDAWLAADAAKIAEPKPVPPPRAKKRPRKGKARKSKRRVS